MMTDRRSDTPLRFRECEDLGALDLVARAAVEVGAGGRSPKINVKAIEWSRESGVAPIEPDGFAHALSVGWIWIRRSMQKKIDDATTTGGPSTPASDHGKLQVKSREWELQYLVPLAVPVEINVGWTGKLPVGERERERGWYGEGRENGREPIPPTLPLPPFDQSRGGRTEKMGSSMSGLARRRARCGMVRAESGSMLVPWSPE